MRSGLRAYWRSQSGGLLIALLVLAVVILIFGPRHDRTSAIVVSVVVLGVFCLQALRRR